MSVKIKNAEFKLMRRYYMPKTKVGGGYRGEVFLNMVIDYEKGKYWITQSNEEGVRFEKKDTVEVDIAKAELVKEALIFAKKELHKINA